MPDALVTAKPPVAEIVQKRSDFLGSGVRQNLSQVLPVCVPFYMEQSVSREVLVQLARKEQGVVGCESTTLY